MLPKLLFKVNQMSEKIEHYKVAARHYRYIPGALKAECIYCAPEEAVGAWIEDMQASMEPIREEPIQVYALKKDKLPDSWFFNLAGNFTHETMQAFNKVCFSAASRAAKSWTQKELSYQFESVLTKIIGSMPLDNDEIVNDMIITFKEVCEIRGALPQKRFDQAQVYRFRNYEAASPKEAVLCYLKERLRFEDRHLYQWITLNEDFYEVAGYVDAVKCGSRVYPADTVLMWWRAAQ